MSRPEDAGGASTEGSTDSQFPAEALEQPQTKGRRRVARRRVMGGGMAARALIVLSSAVLLASIIMSLAASGWQSFTPISGIGSIQQLPLQPESFGDSARFTPEPSAPVSGAVAAFSGQTHKPTARITPTSVPASGGGVTYPASYTGSWSGGVGQGCPGGGAPKPPSNIIYNAANYGVTHTNMVALTFDDGPTPYSSPAILSFLEQTHTPATFFVLGQYAHAYPWLIQREAADGFAIGVHTWNHPDMRLLSLSARAYQFGATIQQLHADLGPNVCIWLWRPPYGAINSSIVAQAGAFGLTSIYWNVDPADWSRPGTMTIVQRVLAQVRPGSIILMHDGPAAREQTAAALPYILAGLRQRGLVPVTLPTLLNSESAPPATPTATATATVTVTATVTATPSASPTATATATVTPATTPATTTTATASLASSPREAIPICAEPLAVGVRLQRRTI